MLDFRFHRAVRRHYQRAIVWAMVPLAVLNGRTVVGCGCAGRFAAVCHCHPSTAGNAAVTAAPTECPRCAERNRARHLSCCEGRLPATAPNDGRTVSSHHCRGVAVYEVIPGTTVSSTEIEQVAEFASAVSSEICQSNPLDWRQAAPVTSAVPHPPDDLVVVLQRLVI